MITYKLIFTVWLFSRPSFRFSSVPLYLEVQLRSKRRKIKPPPDGFISIDEIIETSDDSDFRIEDHVLGQSDYSGDSDDISDDADEDEEKSGSDNDSNDGENKTDEKKEIQNNESTSVQNVNEEEIVNEISLHDVYKLQLSAETLKQVTICSVCLGDRSDESNEIMECDSCGITVHEGCYGVQDSDSVSSANSSCSTEPWFCECCKAGVTDPNCELCPNRGGIFKETDIGKWVHLICALYIPGIAFIDPDRLTNVTLFEISASKWGSKACEICCDLKFCRTGMTIQCDAGMCKSYFHVTCGQRDGLLTEASNEDLDQADPFFAHCKLHSDKSLVKHRKRNWLALQARMKRYAELQEQQSLMRTTVWKHNQKRLTKYNLKFDQNRTAKTSPWIPTHKRPRLLNTSSSATNVLWNKSELMGLDMNSFQKTREMMNTLEEIPKKWNVPPALNVEFVGYFVDRDSRLDQMKISQGKKTNTKKHLTVKQRKFQPVYDGLSTENFKLNNMAIGIQNTISIYSDLITNSVPEFELPCIESLGNVPRKSTNRRSTGMLKNHVKAATQQVTRVVEYSLYMTNGQRAEDELLVLPLINQCGKCCKKNDQHLLAQCDKCREHYHIGCLDPPLARIPVKTKTCGWICSECDKREKRNDFTDVAAVNADEPRKLRRDIAHTNGEISDHKTVPNQTTTNNHTVNSRQKRKRDKQRDRYSPDFVPPRKRKQPQNNNSSAEGIRLMAKVANNSTSSPNFYLSSSFVISSDDDNKSKVKKKLTSTSSSVDLKCDTCSIIGPFTSLVQCDECRKAFHFRCLDPPMKKSPKVRGYSWHCAQCDPSDPAVSI